jgi:hypothetical protein
MTIFLIIVLIVFVVIAGAALGSSPSRRMWRQSKPGEPGAVDPTGSPVPRSSDFERPRNEGDLL